MNANPKFHWKDREAMRAFAQKTGFGTLFAMSSGEPRVAHVPFILSDADHVRFHLARPNALTRALEGTACLLVVTGSNAYVSPDYYGLDRNQVPTWNYLAVEMEGTATCLGKDELLAQIDALSWEQERRLAPKPPWTRAKMDPEIAEKMTGAIVGFELAITQWRGTAKLNQNKPADAREKTAGTFEALGQQDMADLIRNPPA